MPLTLPVGKDCQRHDPLTLTLGQGDTQFTALAPGEEPQLHYGPQGGTHLLLAVRVENATVNNPTLDIQATAYIRPDGCGGDGGTSCTSWLTIGSRRLLAVTPDSYQEMADGAMDVPGILLVVNGWTPRKERKIDINAIDPCMRSGMLETLLPAQSP
jgi:hypothetical protein